VKRFIDVVLSIFGLLIISPLFVVLVLLVQINIGSPVLFFQVRPGKNEKPFRIIKLRTMTDARDEQGHLLPDADRLTRFGRILRKTSSDELPSLWNVLAGDMSLVGPRPLLVKYLPYMTTNEKRRHLVRPGITGLAQISGRNSLGWDERLSLDVKYVETCSLLLDFKIIFKTVSKVFFANGVSPDANKVMEDLDVQRRG